MNVHLRPTLCSFIMSASLSVPLLLPFLLPLCFLVPLFLVLLLPSALSPHPCNCGGCLGLFPFPPHLDARKVLPILISKDISLSLVP